MYNNELANTSMLADNDAVSFNCHQLATVGLEITGTFVGTLLFEYTIDGRTWHPLQDLVTRVTQSTVIGAFIFDVVPYKEIRTRFHPVSSGNPAVFFFGKDEVTKTGPANNIPLPGTPVNAVAATVVLTSDNTDVADGDTVTIGTTVYRFKNTIAQLNDIHRTGTADTTLTNLKSAINGTGTAGTDYFTGTPVNPDVSSSVVASHAITLTAKTKGAAGNSIASTETSAHLSFGAATLTGGVNGTPALLGQEYFDATYLYLATADNTVSDANWIRYGPGSTF